MPPPKWSTQLLLFPHSSPSDDDEEASWVTTPMSGVYGLCFGRPDAPFESCCSLDEADGITASNNRKRKEQPSSPSNAPHCGCKCRARIVPPRNSSTGSSVGDSIFLSLPLPTGKSEPIVAIDDSVDGKARSGSIDNHTQQEADKYTQTPTFLTSTMIGRAVFFPKDTRIRVEHRCGRSPCHSKWRLVLHRELSRGENAAEYAAVNLNPRENQTKHLICGECGKKFPSIKGIKAHYLTAHASNDESGSASIPSAIDEVPSILRRPLEVVYDDEAMAVVVKPQGVNVMGGRPSLLRSDLFMALKGSPSPKAVVEDGGNSISNDIKRSPDLPLSKPVAVHRLDAPTGGLLLIAKTKTAEVELKECFRSRTCKKRYRAIVFGRLGGGSGTHADEGTGVLPSGVIDVPIDKKEAVTKWQVIEYTPCLEPAAKGFITTVDLWPDTGRKHQLRKHMQALGCPIWGDKRYGPYNVAQEKNYETKRRKKEDEVHSDHVMLSIANGHNDLLESATVEQCPHCRLCLFALELTFPHPITKQETTVCISEPQWYQDIRQYCLRLTRAK